MEAEATELGDSEEFYIFFYGPSSSIWRDVIPEAADAQTAFSKAMDLSYSPAAPYEAFTRSDWERSCQYWNTGAYKEAFDRHCLWNRDDWLSKSQPTSFWVIWCAVSSCTVPP